MKLHTDNNRSLGSNLDLWGSNTIHCATVLPKLCTCVRKSSANVESDFFFFQFCSDSPIPLAFVNEIINQTHPMAI